MGDSKQVSWLIAATVVEGKKGELEKMMKRLVPKVKANEAGCLSYEWSLGDDGTFHLYERYADSDAVLTHMQNLGADLPVFMSYIAPTAPVQVWGNADNRVREAFTALGPVYVPPWGGFTR